MKQKKTFTDELETAITPAMAFISTHSQEEESTTTKEEKAPEGFYKNPIYIEKRTRRLQVLLKPSLYTKLKDRATTEGESVNEALNNILEREFSKE